MPTCRACTTRFEEGWDGGLLSHLLGNYSIEFDPNPDFLTAVFAPECEDCESDLEQNAGGMWGCRDCYPAGCECWQGMAPCPYCESLID